MSNSKLVYSTGSSIPTIKDNSDIEKNILRSDQKVRLHLERKRGGKIQTIIKGLSESHDTLKELTRELKKRCATGGTIKNTQIVIQGNQRELVKSLLSEKGYNVKLSGG